MTWQLYEAKQRFSEVIDLAITDGPQIVTRNGKEVAAIISIEEHRKQAEPPMRFKEFLLSGPFAEFEDSDFERPRDLPREVEL